MQPRSYSPYSRRPDRSRWRMPSFNLKPNKWVLWVLGVLLGIFLLIYLCLGELRFFANHIFRLAVLPKNYLIVLQNDYELRPTGGFITAYGNLDTLLGFVRNLSFKNSYDIDTESYITPPYPHEELLKNEWYEGYTFRDANWEPDFSKTAAELTKFYLDKYPDRDVDGVITINFSWIESLVDKLGGLELAGETLTSQNLFEKLEFEVNNIDRHSEEALENRKNILSDLAPELMSKIKWHPFRARAAVVEALESKNIMVWLKSPGLQRGLEKRGWSGAMPLPEKSDFVAVNLANLGSKKADRYIEKSTHIYANLTKEIPAVNVEVTLRYPGFTNIHADNYKGYLRLYVPAQATFDSLPVDSRETVEGDFKVVGIKLIMPAGSKTTLSLSYTLPRSYLASNQYQLRLVRQSGSDMFTSVTVEGVQGMTLQSSDFTPRENRGYYRTFLTKDVDLSAHFLPDQLPPYPIEQVFEDLNTIKIYWSEPIDPVTGGDAVNYTITDLNRISEKTDEVKVVYAEVTNASETTLELEGITEQTLERYNIEIRNVKDQAGIALIPNPKAITVVQRINSKPTASPELLPAE